jgi:hypothetical protein
VKPSEQNLKVLILFLELQLWMSPQEMFFEHFYDISKFWVKTLRYLFLFLGELWLFRVPYTSPLPAGSLLGKENRPTPIITCDIVECNLQNVISLVHIWQGFFGTPTRVVLTRSCQGLLELAREMTGPGQCVSQHVLGEALSFFFPFCTEQEWRAC